MVEKAWWLKLIVFGLGLRLLVSSFLYHPDLKSVYHDVLLIGRHGWIGGYLAGTREGAPLYYPPPVYLILGSYQKLTGFLFSRGYWSWMGSSSLRAGDYKGIFRDLLAMKVPLILADMVILWLLVRMVPGGRKKIVALVWLSNPFSLYAIYGTSHFDVMPTALVLASVLCFRRRRTLSYLLLGVGTGFKVFPLLLLPFWLVFDDRRNFKRMRDMLVFVVVVGLCLAPIIRSREALSSVFLSNLTGGLTRASFDIGNHESLPIYLVWYSLLLMAALFGYLRKVPIEVIPVAVLGGLLGMSNFHPQWMVWLMPFLLLLVVDGWLRWRLVLFLLLSYWGVVFLINDIYMTFGILSPMNNAFASLPTIRSLLDNFGVGSQLQGAFHGLFLACIILAVGEIFKGTRPSDKLKKLERVGILGLSSLWVISFAAVILAAHVFLSFKGAYVDGGHSGWMESEALTREKTIRQDFTMTHNNFLAIEVVVKNVGLKNKSDVHFNLADLGSGAVVPFIINGAAIGDDYNLKLNFSRIRQSGGHRYFLTISSPQAPLPTTGENLLIPYDGASGGDGLFINGRNVPGSLAYTTYYNPGGVIDNLRYTIANIYSEI